MEIHFIRHGKTYATEEKLYCGQTDLPLSATGSQEIARLRDEGVYPSATVFFSSGMLRATQTLAIICGDIYELTVPGLSEIDFGSCEMKSHEELNGLADYQAWIDDTTGDVSLPGGESRNQFVQRVVSAYHGVVEETLRSACLSAFAVCHGGTISRIMEHLFPGTQNYYEWLPEPGHGYTLSYQSGEPVSYHKI